MEIKQVYLEPHQASNYTLLEHPILLFLAIYWCLFGSYNYDVNEIKLINVINNPLVHTE